MARRNAFETVKVARRVKRPGALQYFERVFDGFVELRGDRTFADDAAVVGGLAWLGETPVTVIGTQKGTNIDDNIARNFGQPHPEGYRKALRLMRQAEKFRRPVITFVNTAGAFAGIGAEERGQGEAIAKNLYEMSTLETPIVSIVTGEGGSGGALALALADTVWALENSTYSILSPEGFASILWRDASRANEAAELMRLTAEDLLKNGVIDKIIPEAAEGADANFAFTADIIKKELLDVIPKLLAKDKRQLLDARYARFRKYGEFEEQS
ncbi:MAG: acetyl-CoA carboxylase carboxyltransferase subunit alpha [Clostridiales bacterium]|jgi:acetyl-CoA carboxylase carboxyl transferase subunit alpha|nr:acetyl-CoA carboxylase carboxyltransferase subunit alpha [Clostridiales bacterium]